MGKRNSIEAETPGACWAAFSSLSWRLPYTLIFSQAKVPRLIALKSFVTSCQKTPVARFSLPRVSLGFV